MAKSKDTGIYNPDAAAQPAVAPKAKPPAKPAPAAPAVTALSALPVDSAEPSLTADAGITTRGVDAPTLHDDVTRIREIRRPFGAFTQKLALAARPGYHRHWFSDEPGRVDEAVGNGWAHVKDKEDKPVRRVVGRGRDGGALYGYAMELPKIFWEEDMQARHDAAQARVDEIKKQPFRAKPGMAKASDRDKFYSPGDEVVSIRGPNG